MEIKRVLIADPSEVFAEDLMERLSGSFEVIHCDDGYTAQSLIPSFQPHVVVMDLMMKGLDGIALADCLQQNPVPPKVLILTKFMTPFMERILCRIPFDYMMYKPCDTGVLADRICELATDPCRDIIMPTLDQCSGTDMLSVLNIRANHKGYRYLQYGMELFITMPDASMTKTLYPAIGDYFHVSPEAVERDIRRAITSAWENCDPHTWRRYFQCDRNGNIPRPTNTVFIATLTRHLTVKKQKRA